MSATLVTAEQLPRLPIERPCELVRGVVIERDFPFPIHGAVCAKICHTLWSYIKAHDIGRAFSNNTGVILSRNPDTVRGPDVFFMSYEKQPRGRLPETYFVQVPDVMFEVLLPDEYGPEFLSRLKEFLDAGVPVVCVLDPDEETAECFYGDHSKDRKLTADEVLTFPDILPGFSVRVGELFE